MLSNLTLLAQAGGGAPPWMTFVTFGGVAAVMYFLMIRPQQKQAAEQKSLLSSLKKGDRVVTQGGLIGKIFEVAPRIITLEVANGVKVQVLVTSVQGKYTVEEQAVAPKAEVKEEK